MLKEALRVQMMEFGRTPRQLFVKKHPKKRKVGRGSWRLILCVPCQASPMDVLLEERSVALVGEEKAAAVAAAVAAAEESIISSGSFYSLEEVGSINGLDGEGKGESDTRLSSHPIISEDSYE